MKSTTFILFLFAIVNSCISPKSDLDEPKLIAFLNNFENKAFISDSDSLLALSSLPLSIDGEFASLRNSDGSREIILLNFVSDVEPHLKNYNAMVAALDSSELALITEIIPKYEALLVRKNMTCTLNIPAVTGLCRATFGRHAARGPFMKRFESAHKVCERGKGVCVENLIRIGHIDYYFDNQCLNPVIPYTDSSRFVVPIRRWAC